MKKLIFTLVIVLFTSFAACKHTRHMSNFEKQVIDLETIDYIEISNKLQQINTPSSQIKKMKNDEVNIFIEKYNSSKAIGPRKAIVKFFIDVYFKDKSKRSFRINEQYIKEDSDYCFDMGDSDFIVSIWNNLHTDHLNNIKHIFEDYINSKESTDSHGDQELMSKSLKSLRTLKDHEDLVLLINVWMYYDPTDFPCRTLVYNVLQENNLLSIEAIKYRMGNKKEWESPESAPYSDLEYLLKSLENE